MGLCGPKRSPRLRLAAYKLATKENLDPEAALLSAGYKRAEVTRAKLQAVSKQKCRIKNYLRKSEFQEIRQGYYIKTKAKVKNGSTSSGISSLTDPYFDGLNNNISWSWSQLMLPLLKVLLLLLLLLKLPLLELL
jgi:hypothetical protein